MIHCFDVTNEHVMRSVIECALQASDTEIYDHGFVYGGRRCHICRSDSTKCGTSTEELLLPGPYYVKGIFEATKPRTCINALVQERR